MYDCLVWSPEGISSSCAINDFLKFQGDCWPQNARLLWDASKACPVAGVKYMLCNVDTMPENPNADFQIMPDSLVLPLNKCESPTIRVVEMFAGGVGGWKEACSHLTKVENLVFSTLALEIDSAAALAYSIAHRVPLIGGMQHVPPSLAGVHKDLIVYTDIAEDHWLELCSLWQPDVVVISAPCPPWSQSGNSAGLHSEQGQLLLRALAVCKLLRPRAIALEQVSAFAAHEHYRLVIQTLRWAGFYLHHSQVIEASDILPIARARWLAIALRVEDETNEAVPFQSWISDKSQVPNTWNAILPEHKLKDSRLFPEQAVLAMSARHDLLPPAKRRAIDKKHVLPSRCTDGSEKLPTLVASYGSQHCFSMSWLQEKGLINHFKTHPAKGPRYWHPIELWLMHGTQGQHFIDANREIAYRHLGNQICTPHALVTLANLLNCLGEVSSKIDVASLISNFIANRNTMSNLHVYPTKAGTLVSGELSFAQQIPPTMGFVPFRKAQICVSGAIFEVWVHHSIEDSSLLQVWDDAFSFLPMHDAISCDPRVMIPKDAWTPSDSVGHNLLTVVHNHEMYIAQPVREALEWFLEIGQGQLRNTFGHLATDDTKGEMITCGFSLSDPCNFKCSFAKYCLALNRCQIRTESIQHTCQVKLVIHGPPDSTATVTAFWTSLFSEKDLFNCGLQIHVETRGHDTHITWSASLSCPWPVHSMKIMLMTRAFATAMNLLKTANGLNIRLKLFAQVVWSGLLSPELTVATLKQCLHAVSWILVDQLQFRLVAKGKQHHDTKLHDLMEQATSKPITAHFVLQMHGGGTPNGTKQGHKTQIKNACAAALLEEGHDLTWTSTTVEHMMNTIGPKELSKVLQVENSKRF
eukprot:s251_g30.t1